MMPSPASAAVKAEAAVWLARINADGGEATRPALDAWLAEDPAHASAFAQAQQVWAILPRAAERMESPAAQIPRPAGAPRRAVLAALAATVALGLGGVWWLSQAQGAYATRPGEQKVTMLKDGSRIALNTDTRLGVQFEPDLRRVRLDRGEAMFEVAADAERPFVVIAGDTRIRAIGTAFIVRRTADDVVVTLIKGRVAVSRDHPAPGRGRTTPVVLRPGEKLTEPENGPTLVEPTSVEIATAWRRGQTVFRDTPLGAAVAELNRYGGPRIVVDDPRLATLPISGVYATNAADFATAAADLHDLRVEKDGDQLHIRR